MSKKEEDKQPGKPAEKKKVYSSSMSFGAVVGKIVKAPKMPKEKKE